MQHQHHQRHTCTVSYHALSTCSLQAMRCIHKHSWNNMLKSSPITKCSRQWLFLTQHKPWTMPLNDTSKNLTFIYNITMALWLKLNLVWAITDWQLTTSRPFPHIIHYLPVTHSPVISGCYYLKLYNNNTNKIEKSKFPVKLNYKIQMKKAADTL